MVVNAMGEKKSWKSEWGIGVRVRADKEVFKTGQHKCFQEANSG